MDGDALNGGHRRYFAACTLGVEPALALEVEALGASAVRTRRGGLSFAGDARLGYAAALWLRSAIRLHEELGMFDAADPDALYSGASRMPWERWMHVDQTLAVDATVRDSGITHSRYAALKLKDAIVDRFRHRQGRRPDVDTTSPDLPLKLVLQHDRAVVYRDLAGDSLHRRGYRPVQVKSPLNEATAAGLLLLTGWDRRSPLVDPMCGSGTFPIEAALLAADRAPGLGRSFAFQRWPDFDAAVWRDLRADAERRASASLPFPIEGCERHEGAVAIARQAVDAAGVGAMVSIRHGDAATFVPAAPPAVVVANPPYGQRLGEGEDVVGSWRALGQFLHRCRGAVAWVLSGNAEWTRHLGLRASQRLVVHNGPIECRWLRYEIGAGPERDARRSHRDRDDRQAP